MAEPAATELAAWLRLTLTPGVGGEAQRHLLKVFGLPEAIFSAGIPALRGVVGAALAERLVGHDGGAGVETALAWAGQPGNRLLTLADADYPRALLTTDDPPTLLYVMGRVELLNRPAVAIVGSRNATRQGEANAESFAAALSAAGLTVVSGLALGIDAAAHRGALRNTKGRPECFAPSGGEPSEARFSGAFIGVGSTVAVIGTGADRIYPAGNEALTREIAKAGAIVSEFPLGTPPLAANFPRRNRLIAGLSRGCLVVEAAERSGSLITARLAAEAGREVFAIPGSIHSPVARGCHKLIRQGAKLVEAASDILEELHWAAVTNPTVLPPTMEAETDPVLVALGRDPCDLDTLAERSGLTPEQLLAMLLPLELEGRVAQLPGGRYQRLN